MQRKKLRVSGITCAGWAKEVQQALGSVNSVNVVKVTIGSGEVEIEFDERLTSLDEIKMVLLQAGFSFSASETTTLGALSLT